MFLKFLTGRFPHPPRLLTRTCVQDAGFGDPAYAIIIYVQLRQETIPLVKQGPKYYPTPAKIPAWESHVLISLCVTFAITCYVHLGSQPLSVLRNQGNFSCRQAGSRIHFSKKGGQQRWPPCPHSRLVRRSSPWSLGSAPPSERAACWPSSVEKPRIGVPKVP